MSCMVSLLLGYVLQDMPMHAMDDDRHKTGHMHHMSHMHAWENRSMDTQCTALSCFRNEFLMLLQHLNAAGHTHI